MLPAPNLQADKMLACENKITSLYEHLKKKQQQQQLKERNKNAIGFLLGNYIARFSTNPNKFIRSTFTSSQKRSPTSESVSQNKTKFSQKQQIVDTSHSKQNCRFSSVKSWKSPDHSRNRQINISDDN